MGVLKHISISMGAMGPGGAWMFACEAEKCMPTWSLNSSALHELVPHADEVRVFELYC